jgi:hypothetical protein
MVVHAVVPSLMYSKALGMAFRPPVPSTQGGSDHFFFTIDAAVKRFQEKNRSGKAATTPVPDRSLTRQE